LNAGIFGLLDRQAVDAINALREGNRYLPGLRAWVGYRTAIVYYDRHDRVGGDGKLSFVSRIKYAMDAITSFSYKPLRLSFVLAGLAMFVSLILTIGALASSGLIQSIAFGITAAVFLVGSFVLLSAGILGEYLGRVYDEVRQRPLSIISKVYEADAVYEIVPDRALPVNANGQGDHRKGVISRSA
jgi:dolichol-phosphate mannosyltransferase